MPIRGGSAVTTILLSVLGILLSVVSALSLWPRLGDRLVTQTVRTTKPVTEQKMVMRSVKVGGQDVHVEVPETVVREVAQTEQRQVQVAPSLREKVWLYGMLGIGIFLGVLSTATALAWFYFLIWKNANVPPVVTEMLKYFVTAFMGIFVGFMGGSSLSDGKQPGPEAPPKAVAEQTAP
jgi:hypothetical protein